MEYIKNQEPRSHQTSIARGASPEWRLWCYGADIGSSSSGAVRRGQNACLGSKGSLLAALAVRSSLFKGRLRGRARFPTHIGDLMTTTHNQSASGCLANVPEPPHPRERREPLPWQAAKSSEEDPQGPRRVEAILNSPTYRLAERDLDFLARDDVRGVRLMIDYLKAELLLQQHGIRNTVVVFGGTRICEPAAARRKVEQLKRLVSDQPHDEALLGQLRIAERVLAKSRYYDVARGFGRIVGAANNSDPASHTVIVTGGGPGIMEAANRGAFDVGAKSVGLNISLPHEQFPNPYITADLCFQFHYFAIRKLHFLERARALVAFPGGYGTFDELFEVLTLIQTRKIKPIPVVLVGESYWRSVVDIDRMVEEGVIDREDRELFWFAETAEEIWDSVLHWYQKATASAPNGS
jgi:uncharacterized protein (TIGR00730 family)